MSELDFWRLAGMAHEASGHASMRKSSGAGKRHGVGRTGMAADVHDPQFELNARVKKDPVKRLPKPASASADRSAAITALNGSFKVTTQLGRPASSKGQATARGAKAPSLRYAPSNPAASSYKHKAAPVKWETRGGFLRPSSETLQRAKAIGNQKRIGPTASPAQFAQSLRYQAWYQTAGVKGHEGNRAEAFTRDADDIDARLTVDRWLSEGDLVASWHAVSPEFGNDIDDFKEFVRRYMEKVEGDLLTRQELQSGEKLDWFSAIHHNTDHRHAHIVIRGRVAGRPMKIDQHYFNNGLSVRARETATEFLGHRTAKQISSVLAREATPEHKAERLSKHIQKRTLGWRLEARVNMRDLDGVDRLRGALKSARLHHKLDEQTGDLTIFTSSHASSFATAEAMRSDFSSLLRLPDADTMKRGMQFSPRVWGRFVTPKTDDRFSEAGVAGVPLLRRDVDLMGSLDNEHGIGIDRAVLRANEVLSNTYREKLIGKGADAHENLVTHGWVLDISADHMGEKIAAELTEIGVQYRMRKEIDVHGDPGVIITAYSGSMDDADHLIDHLSRKFDSHLVDMERHDAHTRHQFAPGIEGRFIPHDNDRIVLGITDKSAYLGGLPETHFSVGATTGDQKMAVSEAYLSELYGAFLQGGAGTNADAQGGARQEVKADRKLDGMEL